MSRLLGWWRGRPIPWYLLVWITAAPFVLSSQWHPAATVLGACALLVGLVIIRRREGVPQSVFDLPLGIYLVLSTVALLAVPAPQESLRRLTTLLLGIAAYYGVFAWLSTRGHEQALTPAVAALPLLGGIVACLGLLTASWPMRYFLDLRFVTVHLPHLGGDFSVSHNQLAGVLVLLLLPGVFIWPQLRSRCGQMIVGVALALMSLALLLTQSRNGLFSLALGLVGGLLWAKRRFWVQVLPLACLLLLPLLVGASSTFQEPLQAPLDWLDQATKAGPAPDQSWLGRLEIWSAATRLIGDYPVLGSGLYEFERVSWANYVLHTLQPDFAFSHAHNLWLHTGTGLGWPGWLSATLLWLAVFYYLARATRAAPPGARRPGVALGAALCGYLSFNTFDMLAPEQWAGLSAWLLLALIAVYVHFYEPAPAKARRWSAVHLAPLFLFVLLLPWLPRNLAHLQLDRARLVATPQLLPPLSALAAEDYRRHGLWYALQNDETAAVAAWRKDPEAAAFLKGQGLRALFHRGDAEDALDWYARALALDPTAATVYYWQGRAYEQVGRDSAALDSYRQAVHYGRGVVQFGRNIQALAWERQGRIFARREQWQQAEQAFSAALSLEPHIDDYRRQLEDVQRALSELDASRVKTR